MPKLILDNSTVAMPTKVRRGGRHAAPKTRIIAMNEVPDPPIAENRSVYADLFAQIVKLPMGEAVEMKFGSAAHADYAKARFRKLAEARKLTLGASRSADSLTRYFWIERI